MLRRKLLAAAAAAATATATGLKARQTKTTLAEDMNDANSHMVHENLGKVAKEEASSAFVQLGEGAVPRTVQSKLGDWISVKDFGAVGDGLADDTRAIQAALNCIRWAGGGTVIVPPGVYLISSTLKMAGNCQLRGMAQSIDNKGASTIRARSGSTITIIENLSYPRTDAGITIEDVIVSGNGNKDGIGIRLAGFWHSLSRVWIAGCGTYGLYFNGCNAVSVSNCRTANCGSHGVYIHGGSCYTFANHNSESNGGAAFYVDNTDAQASSEFVGCYSERCKYGYFVSGRGVRIIGGRANDHQQADLLIADSPSCYDITVIGGTYASASPAQANIVIGASAYGTTILNPSYHSIINNASQFKVTLIAKDESSDMALSSLKMGVKGVIGGVNQILFRIASTVIGNIAGVFSIKSSASIRLTSDNSIQFHPQNGEGTGVVEIKGDLRLNGRLDLRGSTEASAPISAQPLGYISVTIDGTRRKIAYYEA